MKILQKIIESVNLSLGHKIFKEKVFYSMELVA